MRQHFVNTLANVIKGFQIMQLMVILTNISDVDDEAIIINKASVVKAVGVLLL